MTTTLDSLQREIDLQMSRIENLDDTKGVIAKHSAYFTDEFHQGMLEMCNDELKKQETILDQLQQQQEQLKQILLTKHYFKEVNWSVDDRSVYVRGKNTHRDKPMYVLKYVGSADDIVDEPQFLMDAIQRWFPDSSKVEIQPCKKLGEVFGRVVHVYKY